MFMFFSKVQYMQSFASSNPREVWSVGDTFCVSNPTTRCNASQVLPGVNLNGGWGNAAGPKYTLDWNIKKIINSNLMYTRILARCIEEKVAPSAVGNGGKSYNKKMQYFTICEEKNLGYRIIKLICYYFLTNLGI